MKEIPMTRPVAILGAVLTLACLMGATAAEVLDVSTATQTVEWSRVSAP